MRRAFVVVVASIIAAAVVQPGDGTTVAPDAADGDEDIYDVDAAVCDRWRPFFRRVNGLAVAKSVVGGAATVLCAVAVVHIVGYGRYKRSLATRLVLGMLLSNLVVAVVDIVPLYVFYRVSGENCGYTVIAPGNTDPTGNCLPTAVMFLGVWSTTMYELTMVLVATCVLRTGAADIPARAERALHLLCLGAGVCALLGFYFRCRDVTLDLAAEVAVDGDRRSVVAADARHAELRQRLNALPGLLWGWALGPVTLAFLGWIGQRVLYRSLLKEWADAAARNRAFDETDMMAAVGLDPNVGIRAQLLGLTKQAYADVVEPLERYVVVIFLFAVPQGVGLTEACVEQTQVAFEQARYGDANTAPLPCEFVVALVMAFRAAVLAAVYLLPDPQVRAEAFDIPELCRKVWAKAAGTGGGGVRFPKNELDGIALVPAEGEGRSSSFGKADTDIKRMGSVASKNLAELDFQDNGEPGDPTDSRIPYQRMD